jgi:excisionase family DNA binding protein
MLRYAWHTTQQGRPDEVADEVQLVQVEEAARRLNLAPKTVRKYLREGKLRGIKTNARGQWRVSEGELRRFAREGPAENS